MASSSTRLDEDGEVPIEDIIFSCSICQATVSDVYSKTESNKGFHSGSGDGDGIVAKLWMAECSHITCSTHLDGGAAPFHPEESLPRASCPRCVLSIGDSSSKVLYAIKGLNEGEFDPMIPSEWQQCPAIKLDSSLPGMEALRFQYMALAHYSRRIRKSSQDALRKQQVMETAFPKERKQRRQLQSDVSDLQARLEALQETESKLKMWESRKPKIFHYLGVFGEMMNEIHGNRALLRDLGYQVAEKSYAFTGDEVAQAEEASVQRNAASTAPRPGLSSATTAVARDTEGSSSARKRKRELGVHDDYGSAQRVHGSSRDLMPPLLPKTHSTQHLHHPEISVSSQRAAPVASSRMRSDHRPPRNQLPYRPPPDRNQLSRSAQQSPYQWRGDELDDFHQNQYLPAAQALDKQQYNGPSAYPQYVLPASDQVQTLGSTANFIGFPNARDDLRVSGYDEAFTILDVQGLDRAPYQLPTRNTATYHQTQEVPALGYRTPERHVPDLRSATIPSPFFKAGSTFARPTIVRPSTRGSHSKTQDVRSRQVQPMFAKTAPHETSFSTRTRDSTRRQAPYQSQQEYSGHQQHALIPPPQTPQHSQPFFQRLDRPPPSAMSHAPSRPQTVRGRMSLPPNSGREMSYRGDQDGALSRIQGVRGLRSRQGQPTAPAPSPAFAASGQLFSAFGSRRSVRR